MNKVVKYLGILTCIFFLLRFTFFELNEDINLRSCQSYLDYLHNLTIIEKHNVIGMATNFKLMMAQCKNQSLNIKHEYLHKCKIIHISDFSCWDARKITEKLFNICPAFYNNKVNNSYNIKNVYSIPISHYIDKQNNLYPKIMTIYVKKNFWGRPFKYLNCS